MQQPIDYSYLGAGRLYLREVGALTGLIAVGNCSALNLTISEEVKELKDYQQGGGGTANEVRRIQAVEVSFTAHDFSPANLARALYGSTSAVASAAVTGADMGAGSIGAFVPFPSLALATPAAVIKAKAGGTAVARANTTAYTLNTYLVPATPNGFYYKVTTAGTSGASVPTFPTTPGATVTDGTVTLTTMGRVSLTENTDYERRNNGIVLLDGAAFTDGEALAADYTKAAADVIQALVGSGKEYELYFDGLNEARSGKATVVNAYRVKLGAAQQISLIGEDYGALEITGKVLKDTTKVGAGVSQYFRSEVAQ